MILWALIGDLDHATKAYKLPNSSSSRPCGLCPVDSSPSNLPWYDFRINACWIPHIFSPAKWSEEGLKKSCIFDLVGVDILSWHPDWMHVKSLGLDKVTQDTIIKQHRILHRGVVFSLSLYKNKVRLLAVS